MKVSKKVLVAAVTLCVASLANAADQGSGKINFVGKIIDAPCSIDAGSANQEVDLGQVSSVSLQGGGKSEPKVFSINLQNCSFGTPATRNKVTVTFSGAESSAGNGLLGINGSASGASVGITDGTGGSASNVVLGKPTKPHILNDQAPNTLQFAAYLQGDGGTAAIKEGQFSATTDFVLAYN